MLSARKPRLLQRLAHGLALLAVLWAALAPTLSHALAAARGQIAPWSEVCSSAVAPDTAAERLARQADGDTQQAMGHMLEHCPYCALQQHAPPVPVAHGRALPLLPLVHEQPALFLHAPRTLAVWATALARAPPLTA